MICAERVCGALFTYSTTTRHRLSKDQARAASNTLHWVSTLGLWGLSVTLALAAPSLDDVLNVTGGIAGTGTTDHDSLPNSEHYIPTIITISSEVRTPSTTPPYCLGMLSAHNS